MKRVLWILATLATALILVACDDDNKGSDHRPASGLGSIVVNNRSSGDFSVYVDGKRLTGVNDHKERAYDIAPGVHRVVLDDRNGSWSYRDDVDVLGGRNTILEVSGGFTYGDFDVYVYFD